MPNHQSVQAADGKAQCLQASSQRCRKCVGGSDRCQAVTLLLFWSKTEVAGEQLNH